MTTADLVKDWLASEGYKYTIDNDGDLQFKYQGLPMWVMVDQNDPLFLRVIMPNVYQLENNRAKVLEILNGLNANIKAVKGFLVDENVWLSIEMYIDSSPEVEDFIERCLDILLAGFRKFAEELRG